VPVEHLRYVPVPAALTAPTALPLLPAPGTNGALLAERDACMTALGIANADKARIAEIQGRPATHDRRD